MNPTCLMQKVLGGDFHRFAFCLEKKPSTPEKPATDMTAPANSHNKPTPTSRPEATPGTR